MSPRSLEAGYRALRAGLLLATAALCAALWVLNGSVWGAALAAGYGLGVWWAVLALTARVRREAACQVEQLCTRLDRMMAPGPAPEPDPAPEQDTLLCKVQHRLDRLEEIVQHQHRRLDQERQDLQQLISDISHQVKTPLANLKMLNATLLAQPVPPDRAQEFLQGMAGQLDKLDFLMQALVKTSRLEAGVLELVPRPQPVYETLAAALGGILLAAEAKGIQVSVRCPEQLTACHDRKWTAEALFNLLDNGVKYTPPGGRLEVTAEAWELYVCIRIADSGPGIPEELQGAVFQRFYRAPDVHDTEGVGLGLYLTRQIVTRQQGFVRLRSAPGQGAAFSVFLPR